MQRLGVIGAQRHQHAKPGRASLQVRARQDIRLPAYASELNPVEGVWSVLKRSLASLAKRDIGQLTALVKTRLRRMQYRPALLEGFLAGPRLNLTPFCNLAIEDRLAMITTTEVSKV